MKTANADKSAAISRAPIAHDIKLAVLLANALFKEHRNEHGMFNLNSAALDRIANALPALMVPIFWKSLNRKRKAAADAYNAIRQQSEQKAKRFFAAVVFKRRKLRAMIRNKQVSLFDILDALLDEEKISSYMANKIALGKQVAHLENYYFRTIPQRKGRYEGKSYGERLPLYACSGELEAASVFYCRNRRRGMFWDVGTDGGGQPEIRFQIHPTMTAKACRLVSRIGSQSRNGGHIHLNCRKDEEIGRRVYAAFRSHLVWFRYLANHARRSGRWSGVDNTPNSFAEARHIKAAAISANTWNHTGTVELRLWGTTAKPEQWAFRARLMQSLARMSETEEMHVLPLIRENAAPVFLEFARWTAENDPQTLREVLHEMRRKGRTTTDRIGAEQCRAFVAAFDASDIRLSGYRRRTITANNQTAGNVPALA
jgi:hypothetical protein